MKSTIKFISAGLFSLLLLVLISMPYAKLKQHAPMVMGTVCDRLLLKNVQWVDLNSHNKAQTVNLRLEQGEITLVTHMPLTAETGEMVIDGQQLYVMPGIIDMHVHIHDRHDLLATLAHGVTHVRSLNGSRKTLQFRDEIKQGQTTGPYMTVGSPAINQKSQYASASSHHFVNGPKEAIESVKQFHAMGFDVIKVYDGLRPDVFQSIVKTTQELGMPFAGHPSFFISTEGYLNAGAQSLEHMEMLYQTAMDYSDDQHHLNRLIVELKKFNVPVTANLIDFHHLAQVVNNPEYLKTLNTETINSNWLRIVLPGVTGLSEIPNGKDWLVKSKFLGQMAKMFYDAGIPMLLGSDAGANLTLHGHASIEEMLLLNSFGISEEAILKSATTVAAKTLKLSEAYGSIQKGHEASLVLLKSDPRKDLSTFYDVQGLIHNNRYFNTEDIASMKTLSKEQMNHYEYMGWALLSHVFD